MVACTNQMVYTIWLDNAHTELFIRKSGLFEKSVDFLKECGLLKKKNLTQLEQSFNNYTIMSWLKRPDLHYHSSSFNIVLNDCT